MATRRRCSGPCRRARSCTSASATTTSSSGSTRCSQRRNEQAAVAAVLVGRRAGRGANPVRQPPARSGAARSPLRSNQRSVRPQADMHHAIRDTQSRRPPMSDAAPATPVKPKKSVALSGTAAGNTALCTVGRSGNDRAYRGYDIHDLATTSEFEEVAHLLVHGKLPNAAELAAYRRKLKSLRGIPAAVKAALEELPPSAHPM